MRGISSAGRAPALQAGGRRFDPVILHHLSVKGMVVGSAWRLLPSFAIRILSCVVVGVAFCSCCSAAIALFNLMRNECLFSQ